MCTQQANSSSCSNTTFTHPCFWPWIPFLELQKHIYLAENNGFNVERYPFFVQRSFLAMFRLNLACPMSMCDTQDERNSCRVPVATGLFWIELLSSWIQHLWAFLVLWAYGAVALCPIMGNRTRSLPVNITGFFPVGWNITRKLSPDSTAQSIHDFFIMEYVIVV